MPLQPRSARQGRRWYNPSVAALLTAGSRLRKGKPKIKAATGRPPGKENLRTSSPRNRFLLKLIMRLLAAVSATFLHTIAHESPRKPRNERT